MSDLLMVSRLELNRNDPLGNRIAERIEKELVPVAESIMAEHRAGYTAEEITAEARRRREMAEKRAKAEELNQKKIREADQVRRERAAPPEELQARLLELTSEGPIKLDWIQSLLRSEGFTGEGIDRSMHARDGRIKWTMENDSGVVWVQRREEEAVPA